MRKSKKYHFIYKTTNLLSGRYYIGMHSSDSLTDGYLGSGTYLRRAINKHGKENFEREILEFCKTREELKSRESEIVNLNEVANIECMNLRVGGCGVDYTTIPSEETCEKISKALIGNRNGSGNKGKTHSEETRRKIGEASRGRTHSDETRKKLRDINTGKTHSDETRKKLSESHIGYVMPESQKQKLSESHKKLIRSESHKKSISISAKNRKKVLLKCPHCNEESYNLVIRRWHFNNCKNKPI